MLDIHAHLFWGSYDADRDDVIARAREAGVAKMICVGTSPEDNPQAIAVAEQYENIFASVGLHPHFFNESRIENQESREETSIHNSQFEILTGEKERIKELMENLQKIARHPKVIAIGECGLDYFSRPAPSAGGSPEDIITDEQKQFQQEGFLAQVALAQEYNLPLIIHTRPSAGTMDAYEDMFAILKDRSSLTRFDGASARRVSHPASHFILHCYMGDTEITEKFLTLPDVYFSFTGNITYPVKKALVGTKDDLTETVKLIPLARLFVETDCPFLAPQEKRGERNEPAYVRMTALQVCALQGVTMAVLETVLDENFQEVFVGKKS